MIMEDSQYKDAMYYLYSTCYSYQTGIEVEIPEEMLEIGAGYVKISEEFMMALEPGIYSFTTNFSFLGLIGDTS